jgi:hypothetical protein
MIDIEDAPDADQRTLRAEAKGLIDRLGLEPSLIELGRPQLVGSLALGVAVARDVDVTITVPRLDHDCRARVAALGGRLAVHPDVRVINWRNDTGRWNTEPDYPDGLYLGIEAAAPDAPPATFDLWFVDEPDRQPDLAHLHTLAPRLDADSRRAIVAIKQALTTATGRPRGFDVYRAVLDHGVQTVEDFIAWRDRTA